MNILRSIAARIRHRKHVRYSHLKTLLTVMRDGILLVGHDGTIEYANETFCEQFCIDVPPGSLTGMTSSEVIAIIAAQYKDSKSAIERIRFLVEQNAPCLGEEIAMASGRTLLRDFIPIELRPGKMARVWHHRDVTALRAAQAKLETLSNIDGLTQIANRRKLDDHFPREVDRCASENLPLSFAMIDVDYFKKFNDRYGHLEGDDCLRRIARTVQQCAQDPRDLIGRYGGEEFFALLPSADSATAAQIAAQVRRRIHDLGIEHLDSGVSPYVTVSIGLVTLQPGPRTSTNDILKAADAALYEAKEQGRNRVCARELL